MKKTIFSVMFAFAVAMVMGSCGNRTTAGNATDSVAVDTDSVQVDTIDVDTVAVDSTVCAE